MSMQNIAMEGPSVNGDKPPAIFINTESLSTLPLSTQGPSILVEYRQFRQECYRPEKNCAAWTAAAPPSQPASFVVPADTPRPVEIRFRLEWQTSVQPLGGRRRRQTNSITLTEESVPLTVTPCKFVTWVWAIILSLI